MGADPYIGEISIFAGNYEPQGWAFCDGRLIAINDNQALFSILGTRYGGDGRINFALPDLRGRSVLGTGQGPGLTARPLGMSSGSEKVTLDVNTLPAHNHAAQSQVDGSMAAKLKCVTDSGTSPNPGGSYIASHANAFLRSGTTADMNAGAIELDVSSIQVNTTVGNSGVGQPHENMHPFLALNYIIALQGIYPPRS